ncbi:zygote arrest protein 1 [Alligator mississippiensis]|uniref:zygote arrest protein 1 n=1 Tax=Alligator mississippiensis TaxID=8496 RepID=UPI002877A61E|nr:zygote arrest protein 1 [Alligator mississippiensis]
MADEAMESYLYSAYSPYAYRYPAPKGKGGAGGWRARGGGGYVAGYAEPTAADYFDNYQRAQLRAILAQVSPGLTPRLRKANTREVGVQVNPRRDAAVQCSLGPRTLPPPPPRRRPEPEPEPEPEQELGSPATAGGRPVRFPRTIAVYSPVASRRLPALLHEAEAEAEAPAGPAGQGAEAEPSAETVRASWEQPPDGGGAEPREQGGEPEGAEPEREQEQEPPAAAVQEPAQGKARLRFQFLEQKYGYYHCKDCNIRWESAYVWCVQGTSKVYFRQFCRTCQKSYNPYRVEDITCQSCKQTRCTCPVKMRHVDPKRPHRQDLCGRCKGKRLSCDSTFSFKYII